MFPVKEKNVLVLKRNDGDGGVHEYHAMLLHDDGDGVGCGCSYSCAANIKKNYNIQNFCKKKKRGAFRAPPAYMNLLLILTLCGFLFLLHFRLMLLKVRSQHPAVFLQITYISADHVNSTFIIGIVSCFQHFAANTN